MRRRRRRGAPTPDERCPYRRLSVQPISCGAVIVLRRAAHAILLALGCVYIRTNKEHIMNKQSMPNRSIFLTETDIVFHHNKSDNRAKAKVFMELEPEPKIVFNCRSEFLILQQYLDNILLKGTILRGGKKEDKEFIWCNSDLNDPMKFSCTLRPPIKLTIQGSNENEFSFVEFSVLNFSERIPKSIDNIDNNEWQINISPTQDLRQNQMSNQMNYVITHTGTIRQRDGSNFSKEQADELLGGIEWFLWFVNGSACGIINIKGKDNNNQIVFEEWSEKIVSPISQRKINYTLTRKVSLALFPYFWKLYKSNKEMLPSIINLYTESKKNEIQEICIIINQIALDMLSHIALGCQYNLTKYPFECSLIKNNICIEISSETYPELAKFAERNKYKNSTHTITEIRNACVHNNPKNGINIRDVPLSVKVAAAELGHIYIEQMLLKLSGCNEGYNTLEYILANIKRLNPPRE